MLYANNYLRFFLYFPVFIFLVASCKETIDLEIEEPNIADNYLKWTHVNDIFDDRDSTILASYRSSDSMIMLSTAEGVSYFNIRSNKIDSYVGLYTGFNSGPVRSYINEYATIYVKDNRIVVHDNRQLGPAPVRIEAISYLGYTVSSLQGDRLYYQHDIEMGADSAAIWKIRYFDLTELGTTSTGLLDLPENEIQIPLRPFVQAHGYINNFWSFDNVLYVSLANNFYRIDRDGAYQRMNWQGQDIFPANMFKIGYTLFAVCNTPRVFKDPLLFSNDLGDTWHPYTNNEDYRSFEYIKDGLPLKFNNEYYLAGAMGLISRMNYVNDKFSINPLAFDDQRPSFFQSLYSSEDSKLVYAIDPKGVWIINNSIITNQ